MTEMLVLLILATCPPSLDGGTNACMEDITNCAVGKAGQIDSKDVERCIEEYKNGTIASPHIED